MQRIVAISVAAGVVAVSAWALMRQLRGRARRPELGSVSDAWLNNPRSYSADPW